MTAGNVSWTGGTAALLLGGTLAAEAGAALLAASDRVALAIATHLLATVGALALAWRRAGRPTAAAAILRLVALLAPSLGPIAIGSGLVILAIAAFRDDALPDARTWYEHLFPDTSDDEWSARADQASRRGPVLPDDDVASFHDVLRWGTLAEREHMLTLIGRSYRPEFGAVLREALAGSDPGLRAQAAAGLSLLEARLSTRIAQAREACGKSPAEAGDSDLLTLAQALGDAAHSGLYDADRSREMREEIVALLRPRFARTGDGALGMLLGRALIQLGDLPGAIAILAAACAEAASPTAYPWLLEALYRSADLSGFDAALAGRREFTEHIVAEDGPLAPALKHWMAAS